MDLKNIDWKDIQKLIIFLANLTPIIEVLTKIMSGIAVALEDGKLDNKELAGILRDIASALEQPRDPPVK